VHIHIGCVPQRHPDVLAAAREVARVLRSAAHN
jgi:hypothetical protein